MNESDNEEFFDAEDTNDASVSLRYDFRKELPQPMSPKLNFSVWQFLKQFIGKELSKIAMPIIFNEPISFLQRLSEFLEYSYLIDEAIAESDPIKRMELISAFAVSCISSNWERIGKPFNPLLGETYELHTSNFKYIAEQVSHHPPVSAFYAESPKFKFYGSIYPKLKFWGKSLEIIPKGTLTVEILPWKEAYTFQNMNCTVHNVIIGKIWIEHSGSMRIVNHSNNVVSDLNFHPVGWFGKNMHRVDGDIYFAQGKSVHVERKMYGKWTEAMFSVDPNVWIEEVRHSKRVSSSHKMPSLDKPVNGDIDDIDDPLPEDTVPCDLKLLNQKLIWKVRDRPSDSSRYYNFTFFTMGLNQLTDSMKDLIAPTDSRFRKDMRLMEEGLIDEAAKAKQYLEEKQRAKRNQQKSYSKHHHSNKSSSSPVVSTPIKEGPIWFVEKDNPYTEKMEWTFTHEYWKRDWSLCPDIF